MFILSDHQTLGKAAIGEYLWVHLLKGTLEERMGGVWFHGKLAPARADVPHLQLTYRSGIGVHPTKVRDSDESNNKKTMKRGEENFICQKK
jgi:hypothetical protein